MLKPFSLLEKFLRFNMWTCPAEARYLSAFPYSDQVTQGRVVYTAPCSTHETSLLSPCWEAIEMPRNAKKIRHEMDRIGRRLCPCHAGTAKVSNFRKTLLELLAARFPNPDCVLVQGPIRSYLSQPETKSGEDDPKGQGAKRCGNRFKEETYPISRADIEGCDVRLMLGKWLRRPLHPVCGFSQGWPGHI